MDKRDLISVITPVYGDKSLVRLLYNELLETFALMDVDFEIIMVNDACPYDSGEEIEKLANIDKRVKFIDLSRNFGQVYAIKAGIDYCNGDWVIVMDCDLQDNPKDIIRFYNETKKGYEIVFGVRKTRKDSLLKKVFSKIYKSCIRNLSATDMDSCIYKKNIGTFSIISKKVAQEYKKVNSYNSNYGSIISWLGFEVGYIDIIKEERKIGISSYNLRKGASLIVSLIVSNTNKPLIFAAYCSFVMFIFCFAFILKLVFDYYFLQAPILGWTSIMVTLFFIGGLLFAYLSILGVYIGGIFSESKQRPLYVIKKKININ